MIALAALMYSHPATTDTQPVALGYILPQFMGAPCSLATDFEDGVCVVANLKLRTPKWNRKK